MFNYVMRIMAESIYKELPMITVIGALFTAIFGTTLLEGIFLVLIVVFAAVETKYLEKYGSVFEEDEEA